MDISNLLYVLFGMIMGAITTLYITRILKPKAK